MVKHPDLAKGVLKVPDAKTKSKQLWERLTEDLNAVSSPIRDIDGWKNVRHASLTRQRSAFRTHQRHRSRDETSIDLSKMFDSNTTNTTTTTTSALTIGSNLKNGEFISSSLTALNKMSNEVGDNITEPTPKIQQQQQKPDLGISGGGNLCSTPISSSTPTTTSEGGYNSSDNVLSSASTSRKASTASEYTSLSSDYTPDNTITPNSTFLTENARNTQYFEINDNIDILTSESNVKNLSQTTPSTVISQECADINVCSNDATTINDAEVISNGNQSNSSAAPQTAARKISRFYVNPVVLPNSNSVSIITTTAPSTVNQLQQQVNTNAEETGKALSCSKSPTTSPSKTETNENSEQNAEKTLNSDLILPNGNGIIGPNVVKPPSSIIGAGNSVNTSAGNTNNSLEQLKIELENITHAQAFASAIVASINNDHIYQQQQQPPQTQTHLQTQTQPHIQQHTNYQQNQEEKTQPTLNATCHSLGQSTPTGPLSSTRTSSTYNSRRTSLDNSVCNDLQNLPTNLIENSENFQNLSYANVEQSGAPENSQTAQKLSKQNSLEKTVPSISAGSADSTTNNPSTRNGGLTQSSIADLEKKLAALRNAEIPDESKSSNIVGGTNNQNQIGDEQQRNVRKISRFCVSRVQEQKANENANNKNTSSGLVTPPNPPTIDLQASNCGVNNDKSSSLNTPTEQLPTPLGCPQQQQSQQQPQQQSLSQPLQMTPQKPRQQTQQITPQLAHQQPHQQPHQQSQQQVHQQPQQQIHQQPQQQSKQQPQQQLQQQPKQQPQQQPQLQAQQQTQQQPQFQQQSNNSGNTPAANVVLPLQTQVQPTVLNLQQHQTQPILYNTNVQHQQQIIQQQQVQQTSILHQKMPLNATAGGQIVMPNLHVQQPLAQKLSTSPNQHKTSLQISAESQKHNLSQQQGSSSQQQQITTSQQQPSSLQSLQKNLNQPQIPVSQPAPPVLRSLLTPTLPQNSSSYVIQPTTHQQHMINPAQSQQSQIQTSNQQQTVYIHNEGVENAMRLQMPQEEPVSLAATHPNLLPTVIQSDIKHNLDSLVNQLCNLRLGTNQHQRLLLLRQRQLIEEDELRLKHYVEYEKFQKAMRQTVDMPTQQPLLYIQPSGAAQQGFINIGGGYIPNTGHTSHNQQQIVNTNSQSAAMSAAVQGYTVMFNPQLTMPTQSHHQQQQQHASTLQQHISAPYMLTNQNIQQQQLQASKQGMPAHAIQQGYTDLSHGIHLANISNHPTSMTDSNYVTTVQPCIATTTQCQQQPLQQHQTAFANMTNAATSNSMLQVMTQPMTSVSYMCNNNNQTEVNLPDSAVSISTPTQEMSNALHRK